MRGLSNLAADAREQGPLACEIVIFVRRTPPVAISHTRNTKRALYILITRSSFISPDADRGSTMKDKGSRLKKI